MVGAKAFADAARFFDEWVHYTARPGPLIIRLAREESRGEQRLCARVMKYRTDFLAVSALTQPGRTDITLSRGNNPRDRRGGG